MHWTFCRFLLRVCLPISEKDKFLVILWTLFLFHSSVSMFHKEVIYYSCSRRALTRGAVSVPSTASKMQMQPLHPSRWGLVCSLSRRCCPSILPETVFLVKLGPHDSFIPAHKRPSSTLSLQERRLWIIHLTWERNTNKDAENGERTCVQACFWE